MFQSIHKQFRKNVAPFCGPPECTDHSLALSKSELAIKLQKNNLRETSQMARERETWAPQEASIGRDE